MTVYARTERGQQAAYDPQSELPRKLKSILRVIDGKTTDDVYWEKLHAFGDVRGMLHSLNVAGLIQPVASGAHQVRSNAGISDAERVVLMQPQRTDDWSATRSAYAQSSFQSTRVSSRVDPDTVALPQSSSLQAELKSARALQSATDLMGSFVLTHMPEHSFQILKELEEVTSLEMLAVLLSGYEQMISHLGELGAQHLVHVKKILRDNL
jgi:hypothetical protein